MNRRDRHREKKKRHREERLRRMRHAQHYGTRPARNSQAEPDDEEDLSPEEMAESEAGVSPFLFESSIRKMRVVVMLDALPDGQAKQTAFDEIAAGREWSELGTAPDDDPADEQALRRSSVELEHQLLRSEVEAIFLRFPTERETDEDRWVRIDVLTHSVERAEARLAARDPMLDAVPAREDPELRTLLRTRMALAECYFDSGRVEQALDQLSTVRETDREDHLGAGHRLLGHFLERADLQSARAILETMAGTEHVVALWGLVLERHLSGDLPGAARARVRAARLNPLIEGILVPRDEVEIDCEPEHAAHLKAEVAAVIVNLGRSWKTQVASTRWLTEGGLSTTPEQRALAAASYSPPVAGLLALGTADSASAWPDYMGRFGLSSEHEPELIRLVSDAAIRESRWPEVWARVHGWRALAQIRTRSAAVPLCILVREFFDDEWLAEEISTVFEAIGVSALPALRELLADRQADPEACGIGAAALGRIARAHPSCRADVVEALLEELRPDRTGGPVLNGYIVSELAEMGVVEAEPLVAELYEQGQVDEFIAGEREEALDRLRDRATPS